VNHREIEHYCFAIGHLCLDAKQQIENLLKMPQFCSRDDKEIHPEPLESVRQYPSTD